MNLLLFDDPMLGPRPIAGDRHQAVLGQPQCEVLVPCLALRRPSAALVEAPRPSMSCGRVQPRLLVPSRAHLDHRRIVEQRRNASTPPIGEDEQLPEVGQSGNEGSLAPVTPIVGLVLPSGEEGDVADRLPFDEGEQRPRVLVGQQPGDPLTILFDGARPPPGGCELYVGVKARLKVRQQRIKISKRRRSSVERGLHATILAVGRSPVGRSEVLDALYSPGNLLCVRSGVERPNQTEGATPSH